MRIFTCIYIAIVALTLVGCQVAPKEPTIIYETKIVNVPVATFVEAPVVDKFESDVKMLTNESSAGEVAKAFKSDWLTLIQRDNMFTDFLKTYDKAKQDAAKQGKPN